MAEKESYLVKLQRIAREYEEKLTPEEWVKSRLYWEDWERLLRELIRFARQEIRRRWWRGERSGVLPEGYDANSVAAEVITRALQGKVRLAPGWTRERLLATLQRKVSHEVRRLHKLIEAGAVRSEWEVLSAGPNGEATSVFAWMRGRVNGMDAARLQARDQARQRAESQIAERLEGEDERKLFSCLRTGVVKRREIASRLGMSVTAVTNCRKRLNRKLDELGKTEPGCPRWVIEELKG